MYLRHPQVFSPVNTTLSPICSTNLLPLPYTGPRTSDFPSMLSPFWYIPQRRLPCYTLLLPVSPRYSCLPRRHLLPFTSTYPHPCPLSLEPLGSLLGLRIRSVSVRDFRVVPTRSVPGPPHPHNLWTDHLHVLRTTLFK